jgi:CheY-like chemotaxis protein
MTLITPVNPANPRTTRRDAAPQARRQPTDRRLAVIVDDVSEVRQVIALAVRELGFSTEEASDGISAWTIARRAQLVITDLEMPNGPGIDLIIRLRAAECTMPVIAMSGTPQLLGQAVTAGATTALEKPFSMQQLAGAITRSMARTQA